MAFRLEVGNEKEEKGLIVKLADITVKRLPLDPETGLGDDELRVTLLVNIGGKEKEIVMFKEYSGQRPSEKFGRYTITMLQGDPKSVELSVTAE